MKWYLIRFCAVLLYNLNLRGFVEASTYRGKLKGLCVPGLNYYPCSGTVSSCPSDTLWNTLSAMDRKLLFYILGVLLLFGVTMGRTIYGFICSFRLVQESLYKMPVPKTRKSRVTWEPSRVKYVILAVSVIILPVVFKAISSLLVLTFCKYIYPAGTLEGGIPLALLGESLGDLVGVLFNWEVLVTAVILVGARFMYRNFCRFLYFLGAIYSLFAPAALLGMNTDRDAYIDCGCCVRTYKMGARQAEDGGYIQYSKCMKGRNVGAIYWKKPWNVNGKI